MKNSKGFKGFICICIGLICVGTIFSGIGFMLGGIPSVSYEPGIGFVPTQSISRLFGGKTEIINEDLQSFTDIKIYAGASNINFIESDKYAVEYCYNQKLGKPEISVRNNTLVYRDRLYDNSGKDWTRAINKTKLPMYVNVYYPADTKFKSVYVDSDMGDFTIDGMDMATLETTMDIGQIDFRRIKVARLEVDADVGNIKMKEMLTEFMEISADVGDVEIFGELRGRSSISGDIGDIYIQTSLSELDYNYDVDVELGEVTINDRSVERSYSQNNGAVNSFELENSIGDIEVIFR